MRKRVFILKFKWLILLLFQGKKGKDECRYAYGKTEWNENRTKIKVKPNGTK
jgi:hypothetical protein